MPVVRRKAQLWDFRAIPPGLTSAMLVAATNRAARVRALVDPVLLARSEPLPPDLVMLPRRGVGWPSSARAPPRRAPPRALGVPPRARADRSSPLDASDPESLRCA